MSSDYGLGDVEAQVARVPNLFLLDTSYSMTEETRNEDGEKKEKIQQLNEGLELFKQEIGNDFQAEAGVDVSLVTFGGDVSIEQEFTPIKQWDPQTLSANGTTPMCEAIVRGANHLEDHKDAVEDQGLSRKRALVWLLTDGRPDNTQGSQDWDQAQSVLRDGTAGDHFFFYAVGIGDEADMNTLEDLISATEDEGDSQAFTLSEGNFKEFFRIASKSATTQSKGGESENAESLMAQQDPGDS